MKKKGHSACTVYEGKIVVSGGLFLKSVESYDYYDNKRTFLPNMVEGRSCHAAVSMGNKMFVIGGIRTTKCEVLDSFSGNFTLIKPFSSQSTRENSEFGAVCIANNIFVWHENHVSEETKIYTYDVDKQMWSNVDCGYAKSLLYRSSCVKYYTQ